MHEPKKTFSYTGRLRSFRYAFRGLGVMLATQHNAWVHAFATVLAVAMGFGFGISAAEWCWVVVTAIAVWTAEALNTAFELLCDVASPDFHPIVEKSKDVAAGAVLISAIGALVVGGLIFGPRLSDWLLATPR